ncbi:MAG TPA: ABC transporter permease [Actinomycetota bacterium]|nr:ABC transporter permease [Actinomycetota bacterium]
MLRYMIRRTIFLVLVLIVVSLFTFLVFVKLPSGDPIARAVGRHPSPELVAQVKKNFGLDQPLYVQYWKFASGMIPWPGLFLDKDVYFSYQGQVPVRHAILQRLPVTIALTVGAAALWLLIGIPIGIVSAVKRGSLLDRSAMIFALVGVSAPTFWLGLLLLYVFHFWLGWLPTAGLPQDQSVLQSVFEGYFVLPWFSLAITSAAFYSRMTRGNLIETMGEDYIRTARAKGLAENKVIYRHGLRAALTPIVTMFGMDVAFLLGGAVITESVFQLPGLGQYALNSLYATDFPAIMGVTMLATFFIVVANFLVDILYAFLDPRVRYT